MYYIKNKRQLVFFYDHRVGRAGIGRSGAERLGIGWSGAGRLAPAGAAKSGSNVVWPRSPVRGTSDVEGTSGRAVNI